MKLAATFFVICGLHLLSACVTPGDDETAIHYLPEARIVRVIPAPWYSGVTATLGNIETETPSGQRLTFYKMDLIESRLPYAPKAGEVCSIAYTHHKTIFDWLTGEADSSGRIVVVMPGERISMAESATCGATVYDFRPAGEQPR
jgi:hypothetical protein